ncbi:DUF5133 domain-containing protein [Streptomyces longispororuber]|uniref:DUF5133 domain-containing protein n=1 Tax=Streptomyces longispororuber TaxID=68230 RepID=UPI00210DDF1F|nr:DUF5133 domain-containing protein [Streptomyces longispororuber]MCQ4214014.1 DUF5133 domain-containing protein [Streptomyces longispororuber]
MAASRTTEETDRRLRRYRRWQRRFLAAPADPRVRAGYERAVRALCTATGERCGREAAATAERRPTAARPHDRTATTKAA